MERNSKMQLRNNTPKYALLIVAGENTSNGVKAKAERKFKAVVYI
jgi:hypothetical protein